ncbi:Protein GrpE [Candidatus Methylobacter favarea]|uniref:Protein GrpE n=1 Tax=Candidatus Methylobacter favarea TaxID=2707345 RepID=A0A8S0WXR4_9GAMM|nr:nucleotide exchange factor GrpE [Candidatus Methylobacter favarea]CAA9889273.1 Protein GrpE [Candidatus Methylobacter favarea]
MSDTQKNRLLEEFQSYLEQTDLAHALSAEQPDLTTLLSEMAGLKSEVKAESRHFKTTLDTLSNALTTLQADHKVLADGLAIHSERLQKMRSETLRTVLLDIVDIYDRLTAGFGVLQNYQPVSSLFSHSRKQDVRFIKAFKKGQSITLTRFEQLLQRHNVHAIDCVGKLLDPLTMSAVEISQDPTLANGIVIEELRKGFLFEENVLRLAEVKVNKLVSAQPSSLEKRV